jgi:uncharacterized alkaline shock family protein YloU
MTEGQQDKDKDAIPDIEEDEREDVVKVSDDVIVTIVASVLSEVEGVASVAGGIVSGILGRKGAGKGIKVEASDQEVAIDVALTLNYGARIPEVAANIQAKLRETVEKITGKYVRAVNVSVQGMRFPETVRPAVEKAVAGEGGEAPSENEENKEIEP